MKLRLSILALFCGLWLWSALALAGVEQISEQEFRDLAQELSPKVNLFKAGWEQDSQAEFYGGTTRDYLYWLKGQFKDARTREQAQKEIRELKKLPSIDVRDFIIGDSDVDIISGKSGALDAADFGVRKIDTQSPDILDHNTVLGKNEMLQGYIPAEKIRLSREGFQETPLGDGVKEIYSGKLSVHFASAEDFAKSKYAQEGINHPILLALRYIRVQAINYFRTHGDGFPDEAKLLSGMDEASAKQVREVITGAMKNEQLAPYLEQPRFKSWINGAIQKSFRSYTNPTAALQLMKKFGVDDLSNLYTGIEPLNQYVFSKFRDPKSIEQALKKDGVKMEEFFRKPEEYFSDSYLYHGTRNEEAFRGILFQGILPSENGAAGPGLYGVAALNKEYSEKWGGDKNRLLRFKVKPEAKIVDVRSGEGQRIFERSGLSYEEFADKYGIDIISYPYETQAFVVKNSAMLEKGEGVYRKIMSLGSLVKAAKGMSSPEQVARLVSANKLSTEEIATVWQASEVKTKDVLKYLEEHELTSEAEEIIKTQYWLKKPEVMELAKKIFLNENDSRNNAALLAFEKLTDANAEQVAILDSLFAPGSGFPKEPLEADVILQGGLYKSPHAAPHANAYVLTLLKDSAENPMRSAHLAFIKEALLSKEDAEDIWKLYKSKTKFKVNNSKEQVHLVLANALLQNHSHAEEIKSRLVAQMKNLDRWVDQETISSLLVKHFPADIEADEAFTTWVKTVQKNSMSGTTQAGLFETLTKLKHQDVLKEYCISQLGSASSDVREYYKRLVLYTNLNDSERAQILRSIPRGDLTKANILKLLENPQRSDELEGATLEYYDKLPSFESEQLDTFEKVISAGDNPNKAREFTIEILGNAKKNKNEDKMRKAVSLIINYRDMGSPELDAAKLRYLEQRQDKYFKVTHGYTLSNFIKTIDFENPKTAQEFQKLASSGKIGDFRLGSRGLVQAAERMTTLSPEFVAFVEKVVAADPSVRKSDEQFFRGVTHLLSSKVKDCAGAFAAMGAKP